MTRLHPNKKSRGKPRSGKSSASRPPRLQDHTFAAPVAVCDHADERELLEEVYQQVFGFMRRKAELERQRTELVRRCEALQHELRAVQAREDDAKVRLLEARRAERRYQQFLIGLTEVADEYRLSTAQVGELGSSTSDEPSVSSQTTHRLQRLVQAPLERIEDMLSSQGISVQQAEPGSVIDVRRFEVAGVIDDAERAPGTVVRTHRPAYVGQDGIIVRKGAAIVTRRGEPVPTDPQSAPA